MQTYCERCGPGLWDEPVNATSNIVFLLAAWAAWRLGRQRGALGVGAWLLAVLAVGVGVGSFLWHTFATEWAMYLDVIPIALFECVFLALYARRAGVRSRRLIGVLLAAFVALGVVLGGVRWLNGVLAYAPVVLATAIVAVHHHRTATAEPWLLPAGAAVFCLALFCRTVDLVVCRQFPVGTHFLWHVLNGVVVYTAMRWAVLTSPPAVADRPAAPGGAVPTHGY